MNRTTSRNKEKDHENISDSLWSSLKYGLGMITVIVIPPLIPGASVRLLIMGYMFVIVGIYATATVVVATRAIRPVQPTKRRRNK